MKKKRKRRTGIQLVIFSLVAAVSILTVILVMGKLTRKKVNIDNSVIITQKDTPTDMTEIKDTHEGMVRTFERSMGIKRRLSECSLCGNVQ